MGKTCLGSYYFKFVVDGVTYKETVKTVRTKKQAEDAEPQGAAGGSRGDLRREGQQMLFPPFLKEVYLPWSDQNCGPASHYKHGLHAKMPSEYFEGRTLAQVSVLAVERFKRERTVARSKFGGARSPHTINSELTTLSGIFNLAARHRFVREPAARSNRWTRRTLQKGV
jgi:hypothetical protein